MVRTVSPAPSATILLTSAPFKVNQIRLEFQYVYATEHTLAEAQAGFVDPFEVTVTSVNSNTILYNAVIDSALNADLVASDISHGVLTHRVGRPKLRDSDDWQWVIIDSSNWVDDVVTITFTVTDSSSDAFNSGIFLENVRNIPEPGSIVLVGIFGAGIGFAAWRRRRITKK